MHNNTRLYYNLFSILVLLSIVVGCRSAESEPGVSQTTPRYSPLGNSRVHTVQTKEYKAMLAEAEQLVEEADAKDSCIGTTTDKQEREEIIAEAIKLYQQAKAMVIDCRNNDTDANRTYLNMLIDGIGKKIESLHKTGSKE